MKMLKDAEWIFVKNIEESICNSYFDYSCDFQVHIGEKTLLYVSACSLYALYINGEFVDCGQYPGYEDYQVYDVLDITDYVIGGKNTLLLTQYVIGTDFSTHRILKPGVIFSIWQNDVCVLNSDENCLSRVNPYYINGDMERVSLQLGYTFKYDARMEETAFEKSVVVNKVKALYERPIKKLPIEKKITGTLKNQGVFIECGRDKQIGKVMQDSFLAERTKQELLSKEKDYFSWNAESQDVADGVYFLFDTQEETVGFVFLDFEVPESCEVLIGYGEHLEDLRVRSFIKNRNFCGSYHATAGRNRFFYPFQRLGMRYLQIHIYSKRGVIHHAGVKKTYYPLQVKKYELHNVFHRRIYEVGLHTLQLCMHEHYEDCPWREQALYAFDSRIQMLCGYYAFEEFEFAKASLRLMERSQREDGLLELCSPGKVPITIPSFSAVFVRAVKEYWEHSGDKAFIEEIFDSVKTIVQSFEHRMQDNDLLPHFEVDRYWNFYEWSEGLSGKERLEGESRFEAPLNALVSDAFYCFARLCDAVKPHLSPHYDELHEKVNKAIHKFFFDSERKLYVTRKGHGAGKEVHAFTQALVLYAGAVPQDVKHEVIQNTITGNIIPCTLSSSIYLYDALLNEGDTYSDYVRIEVERRWGSMLFKGATSFWETDEGERDFDNAGSLCHGWSAVPVYIFKKFNIWKIKEENV